MEEREPDGLLELRVAVDFDVRSGPEVVQELALLGGQPLPSGLPRARERGFDLRPQRRGGPLRGPAVGEEFGDLQAPALGHVDRGGEPGEVLLGVDAGAQAVVDLDLVVHRGGDPQPGHPGLVHQHGLVARGVAELADQRRVERGGDARVVRVGLDRFVGQQVGLHDELQVLVERFDLVADRGDRALGEGDQPFGGHPHAPAGGGGPFGDAPQRAAAEVEHAVVRGRDAVAHVQRLVLDQQPDDLAVGHVDDGLAFLRIAVTAFGVREFVLFVEAVEIRAGQPARFAFLKRAAQSDVSVRHREGGFGALQRIHVETAPAQLPRRAFVTGFRHLSSSNSARSSTTTSAPCARSASAWFSRLTPTT